MQWYLVTLLCLSLESSEQSIRTQSFVYQKDMSEYCRRQVISSVFLGRHVTEANSQILHFSQLEVPYSCDISIRAEPGSDIVLVLELNNMSEACRSSQNGVKDGSLKVYELGETFGGYWGSLPIEIMKKTPSTPAKYYTLKTTRTVDCATKDSTSRKHVTTTKTSKKIRPSYGEITSFTIEVPLVNVSGILVDTDVLPKKDVEEEDILFDVRNDVGPKPEDKFYSTTVLPLIQYSIHRENDRRFGDTEGNVKDEKFVSDGITHGDVDGRSTELDGPRYAIDYEVFTPNPGFKFPFLEPILSGKQNKFHKGQKFNANKILKFNKIIGPRRINRIQTRYHDHTEFYVSNKFTKSVLHAKTTSDASNYKLMDELIRALIRNHTIPVYEHNKNTDQLLEKVLMQDTSNVYLEPNISIYNNMRQSSVTQQIDWSGTNTHTSSIPTFTQSTTLKINTPTSARTNNTLDSTFNTRHTTQVLSTKIEKKHPIVSELRFTATENTFHSAASPHLTTEEKTVTSTTKNSTKTQLKYSQTKSVEKVVDSSETAFINQPLPRTNKLNGPLPIHMVNHESFENIVRAAPKLADVLNKNYPAGHAARKGGHRKGRRKRLIKAIDIELARPHRVTIQPPVKITPQLEYDFNDIQDFAQLVELEDDEMDGRLSHNDLQWYVGKSLLDACDIPVQKSRQVFLFNTSRILLSISNFTAKRMTLVVTPARILPTQGSRCPEQHLECQVSGARVCIDSMCACDGVPNCGSYDVYDEDRLRCNKYQGAAQQAVYLAAFAFLAVLFTALYTVHYWLRRCVPKVSDAFFIYTDGTENILYLDSIMRSPRDQNDDLLYNSNIFAGEMLDMQADLKQISKMERFKRWFPWYRKKDSSTSIELGYMDQILSAELVPAVQRRRDVFSLSEAEIIKFEHTWRDESTQTGESLEMRFIDSMPEKRELGVRQGRRSTDTRMMGPLLTTKGEEQSKASELSMLKLMKQARAARRRSNTPLNVPQDAAHLQQNTRSVAVGQEREIQSTIYDSKTNLQTDSLLSSPGEGSSIKLGTSAQARKHLRFNENLMTISSDDEDEKNVKPKQSAFLGPGKPPDLEDEKSHEHSTARDFKRFWSSNKGSKKTPKKKNPSSIR